MAAEPLLSRTKSIEGVVVTVRGRHTVIIDESGRLWTLTVPEPKFRTEIRK